MPWGKLDDALYDHPKVEALPPTIRLACVGLWTLTSSYSNRHLTDGHVATGTLRKLGGTSRLVEALIEVGLYERNGSGIVIHDFLDHNKSRVQVLDERVKRAESGRLGGEARGRQLAKQAASTLLDEPEANAKQSAKQNPSKLGSKSVAPGAVAKPKHPGLSPRPVPSRPVGTTPSGSTEASARDDESLDDLFDLPAAVEPR